MESDSAPAPAAALSGDPAVFSAYLQQSGQLFVLLGSPHEQEARLRFTGRFEGVEVVWDCTFVTLQSEMNGSSCRVGEPVRSMRCFIEIGAPGRQGVPLRVGLDLARIDRPEILKMIVMIRNYRRLRRGRHEFGAPFSGRWC